jgi:hypothetical protein
MLWLCHSSGFYHLVLWSVHIVDITVFNKAVLVPNMCRIYIGIEDPGGDAERASKHVRILVPKCHIQCLIQ